ncbi:hypothetical protein ACHAWF_012409 [Thalassiosira exigua]
MYVHVFSSFNDSLCMRDYQGANCNFSETTSTGRYGCDSPRTLVSEALEYAINVTAAKTPTSPAFVLITGDFIRHGVDQIFAAGEFSEGGEARAKNASMAHDAVKEAANSPYHAAAMDAVGEILQEVVSMVKAAFPESEIVVSIGNNDVVPDYYLQLQDEDSPLGSVNNLTAESAGMIGVIYNALSNHAIATEAEGLPDKAFGKATLTPSDAWTFLRGGYYSRNFHNGTLTILSLNTVLYSINLQPEAKNTADPGWQFLWMKRILLHCRQKGTQAIIVGHIPPTVGSYRHAQLWKESYVKSYYEIVGEFDDIIIGQLFGHLHSDEFRVGPAEQVNSTDTISMIPPLNTPLLLGPSVTPLHGNDPSIRVVEYGRRGGSETQGGAYRLLDYESHRYTISGYSRWSKLYTFSEAYSSASDVIHDEGLSANAFRAIIESMKDYRGRESRTLKLYRSLLLSGANGKVNDSGSPGRGANIGCDSTCRDDFMCTLQSATSLGYENCLGTMSPHWTTDGKSIFGLVAATIFLAVAIVFGIVRFRKQKRREQYESTPSVGESVQNIDQELA